MVDKTNNSMHESDHVESNSKSAFPNIESQLQGDEIITHTSFNQDQDAFAIGTTKGFSIFSLEPFCFRVKR